jgi:hypothetical protein
MSWMARNSIDSLVRLPLLVDSSQTLVMVGSTQQPPKAGSSIFQWGILVRNRPNFREARPRFFNLSSQMQHMSDLYQMLHQNHTQGFRKWILLMTQLVKFLTLISMKWRIDWISTSLSTPKLTRSSKRYLKKWSQYTHRILTIDHKPRERLHP